MVFVVEGERDADALTSLGLVATTNVGGAGTSSAGSLLVPSGLLVPERMTSRSAVSQPSMSIGVSSNSMTAASSLAASSVHHARAAVTTLSE